MSDGNSTWSGLYTNLPNNQLYYVLLRIADGWSPIMQKERYCRVEVELLYYIQWSLLCLAYSLKCDCEQCIVVFRPIILYMRNIRYVMQYIGYTLV